MNKKYESTLLVTTTFHLMEDEEIYECTALLKEAYPIYPEEDIKKDLKEMFKDSIFKPVFYVAKNDNSKIIGIVGYGQSIINFGYYDLCYLAVDIKYLGQGYGWFLTDRVIQEIKNIAHSKVLMVSSPIPDFCKKFGFKKMFTVGTDTTIFLEI